MTEINDYFRLLWARVGTPICPNDGTPITSQSPEQMVDRVLKLEERTKLQILSPIVRNKKGGQKKTFEKIKREGFVRVQVDGDTYDIEDVPELNKNQNHSVNIVVDRIVVKDGVRSRLFDSFEAALRLSDGYATADIIGGDQIAFSEQYACPVCGFTVGEMEPRLFSFNAPLGACPECEGLGIKLEVDEDLVVPDRNVTLRKGAIMPWNPISSQYYPELLEQFATQNDIDMDTPFDKLPAKQQKMILKGNGAHKFHFHYENDFGGVRDVDVEFEGVLNNVDRRYRETNSDFTRDQMRKYMTELTCQTCHGYRLNRKALSVKVDHLHIGEVSEKPVSDEIPFFKQLHLSEQNETIARPIIKEIVDRLTFFTKCWFRLFNTKSFCTYFIWW